MVFMKGEKTDCTRKKAWGCGWLFFLIFIGGSGIVKGSGSSRNEIEIPVGKNEIPGSLFENEGILHLDIGANWEAIRADVGKEPSAHPAWICCAGMDEERDSIPVLLETRGNFRRNPQNCDFPPLRCRMDPASVCGTLFEGQDNIKLITHCRSENDTFRQCVLKEFLLYKWYNLLTPYSYRVRLAKIRYMNESGKQLMWENYGIFLEKTSDMAARNEMTNYRSQGVYPENLDPCHYYLLAMFEYLIENNDWSVEVMHNVKLLAGKNGVRIIPVGYDFDWSGVINAPYRMNTDFEEKEEGFLFKGRKGRKEDILQAMNRFMDEKGEMYNMLGSVSGLSDESTLSMETRLDEFYTLLKNRRMIRKHILKNCRKRKNYPDAV